jgi:exopolysaccharide production protein ExoY
MTNSLEGDLPIPSPGLTESRPELRLRAYMRPRFKRTLDIAITIIILAFIFPLLIIIGVLIATEKGPIFFGHRRIGRHRKEFLCWKFRTMHPSAERLLAELLARDPVAKAEWVATRKLRQDPRITRVGRFLRATSLDELPQLFNVIRGDMSLVGPRPITLDELSHFYAEDTAAAYLSIRPGITGLWQVSGRGTASYQERVALDLAYARNPSLRGDFRILARTVRVVLSRQGAW